MVFVADDLAGWLIGLLADAGRKKLTGLVLGSEQERALRAAATAAVQLTAAELRPGDAEQAEHVALVISQVFGEPALAKSLAGQGTVLEALQAGIAAQLAVLDDASLTGTGQSPADVLGVRGAVVAAALTGHLAREIVARGARGGPLFPLASQLNDDVTHLQGQRIESVLGQLAGEVREALARLDATHTVVATTVALTQLPLATAGFTGRDDELAALAELLDPVGSARPVVVSAVAGLAGVGKTTLAVQAGHVARQRGWFSGGVLFVDLHGYDEAPVEPSRALDVLLRALGVSAGNIPPTVEERAGLYRSVLAEITEPVLVVADNASAEAQVRPLLPGAGPHKVLVTSRNTLAGLDARLVDVAVLDDEVAVELLETALRAARPDDDRVRGDLQGAALLAAVCGGLPLALQITATLLKADPRLSAAELADRLSDETERLAELRYVAGSGTGGPSVAAAFELSYRRLDAESAQVFRLLPVSPGPDISTAAVAVLTDLPAGEARRVLVDLSTAHLIEAVPRTADRWRMHDLVRLYAQQLSEEDAEADGREQARDRLLAYYLDMAGGAEAHLRALPVTAVPVVFTGREDALAWLDAERASLIAAVQMAANTGRDMAALGLPLALAEYFDWRRHFDDKLATMTISLNAARRLGDRANEGAALITLGNVLQQVRRFEEAITACQDAAAIFRQIGDRDREGTALNNLGIALREMRRFEEAIIAHQEDLAICRQIGDRDREGTALNNLGIALREMRRFEEAIIAHQNAAGIHGRTGNRYGECMALNNLGIALDEVGRPDEAVIAYQRALAICRETGDRHSEAIALDNLGRALQELRQFEEAIAACQDATAIFQEAGDRHGEGKALSNLGVALHEVSRPDEAVIAYQRALAICRETGDRHSEAIALDNLGRALQELRRFEEAIAACLDAVTICRETGDRHTEGAALNNLGAALAEARRFEEAITACQDAAAIFRETGDRDGERIALYNLEAARTAQGA